MLRLAGAVMVLFSAAAYAMQRLGILRRRLELVRELKHIIACISSYIGFSQLPLEELITELMNRSEKSAVPALEYFLSGLKQRRTIPELWRESLVQLPLSAEEIRVFAPLGDCLGMTDRALQIKTADAVIREADICEERLLASLDRYRAVDFKLMIMAGAVAVIVLI